LAWKQTSLSFQPIRLAINLRINILLLNFRKGKIEEERKEEVDEAKSFRLNANQLTKRQQSNFVYSLNIKNNKSKDFQNPENL
jgi:hypothetical protein